MSVTLLPMSNNPTHLFSWSKISAFWHLVVLVEQTLISLQLLVGFFWKSSLVSIVGKLQIGNDFYNYLLCVLFFTVSALETPLFVSPIHFFFSKRSVCVARTWRWYTMLVAEPAILLLSSITSVVFLYHDCCHATIFRICFVPSIDSCGFHAVCLTIVSPAWWRSPLNSFVHPIK